MKASFITDAKSLQQFRPRSRKCSHNVGKMEGRRPRCYVEPKDRTSEPCFKAFGTSRHHQSLHSDDGLLVCKDMNQ